MGAFQFLQNEITGAKNAVQNDVVRPVSSAFNAVRTAISPYVAAAPYAARYAVHPLVTGAQNVASGFQQLGATAQASLAPVQGIVNAARQVPALGYGALGLVQPGHTFQGNVQAFNQAVPQASFADRGFSSLVSQGKISAPVAKGISYGANLAGQMLTPLPGIGKIAALESLTSPAMKLGAYTAVRAGEGAAYGGAQGLAANGSVQQGLQGAKQGALFGAAGNVLLSPKLALKSLQDVAGGTVRMASNVESRNTIWAAASKLYAPVEGSVPPPSATDRIFTEKGFDSAMRTKGGVQGSVQPSATLSNEPKVRVSIDGNGNIQSVVPDRPEFADHLAASAALFPSKIPSGTVSRYERFRMKSGEGLNTLNMSLNRMQARSSEPPVPSAKSLMNSGTAEGIPLSKPAYQEPNPNAAVPFHEAPTQTMTPKEAKMTAQGLGLTRQPKVPQGNRDLGVIGTVKASDQTTSALAQGIEGQYTRTTNKADLAAAHQAIATDPNQAYMDAVSKHDAQNNIKAILLAKQYELNGNPDMAANLMVQKAKQALTAGQGNQVYSLWDKLAPETIGRVGAKTIEDYNASAKVKIPSLTGDQYQALVSRSAEIQKMAEGRDKGLASQKLLETIGRLVPSSAGDKAFALFRTGLLTGFRTPGKVLVSHAAQYALEQAKNLPASLADQAMSLVTGRRSLVATGAGNLEGARKGTLAAVDNFFHGYNAPNSGGAAHDFTTQVHFGDNPFGKAAQAYVDIIGRLHGSLYKPFFGAQHLNSLYDMALTEARNQGLSGSAKQSFVHDFVSKATDYAAKQGEAVPANPPPTSTPEGAAIRATKEALYTTFQNRTWLGNLASDATRRGGNITRSQVPFTQIPSSIAMKLIDYSPVGVVKGLIENIGRGKFDQRDLAQALGRAAVGTGVMAVGAALYNKGLMTLGYPKDARTQALWEAEGKTANSILVDGKWRALSSLGPAGDAMSVGGGYASGMDGTKKTPGSQANAFIQGGIQGLQTIAASPYLQQGQNILGAINDPVNKTNTLIKNEVSSLVPTALGNIASATDTTKSRVQSGPLQAVQNKIPGLREQLPPNPDVFGNIPQRSGSAAANLLDPFYSSTSTATPLTNALDRLAKDGQNATPVQVGKSLTQLGWKVPLTPQQQTQVQVSLGARLQPALTALVQSPQYQQAVPEIQKNLLDNAAQALRTQAEQGFVRSLGPAGLSAAGATKTSTGIPKLTSPSSTISTGKISAKSIPGGRRVSSGGSRSGGRMKIIAGHVAKLPKLPKPVKSITIRNASATRLAKPKLAGIRRTAVPKARPAVGKGNRTLARHAVRRSLRA